MNIALNASVFYDKAHADYLDQNPPSDSAHIATPSDRTFYSARWTSNISLDGVIRVTLTKLAVAPGFGYKPIGSKDFQFSPEYMLDFFRSHYGRLSSRFYFVHILAKTRFELLELQNAYLRRIENTAGLNDPVAADRAEEIAFQLALVAMLEEAGKTGGYYNAHNPYAFDIARAMHVYDTPSTLAS